MKRIATILLLIFGIFSVSSCDLDPDGTYTFSFVICEYSIADSDTATAITDYIVDTLGDDETFSITGKQSEAVDEALERFQEIIARFDSKEICPKLGEDDYIVLGIGLVRKNGIEGLAYMTWKHEDADIETSEN